MLYNLVKSRNAFLPKKGEENMKLEKLVKERIEENKKLFTEGELDILNNYVELTKKVYIIAIIDGGYWK